MKNSTEKFAWIVEQLAAGHTIAFCTPLRVTTFSPATVAKLKAAGVEAFKLGTDGALRFVEGFKNRKPRYVSGDWCDLRVV